VLPRGLHVSSGTEASTCPRDDECPNVIIVLARLDHQNQFLSHLEIESVKHFRPIERDRGYGIRNLQSNSLSYHFTASIKGILLLYK
jgi:hypothetical protein